MNKWVLYPLAALAAWAFCLTFQQSRDSLLAPLHAETFPLPAAKKLELRNREAQKVEAIFEALETRKSGSEDPGAKYRISESELNSYLSYLLEKQNISGVDVLFVRLHSGSFSTYAVINVDAIQHKDRDRATRVLMQTILAGKQYVSAEGSLRARDGQGQYILTGARINEVDIPPGIVNALINVVGKRQNPPFDLTKPFTLPYKIREAEISPGYLEIS